MRSHVFAIIAVGLACASGCAVKDNTVRGTPAPAWWPAFLVRDSDTTQQWGGQTIYGTQTNRVDTSQQPAIGPNPNGQQDVYGGNGARPAQASPQSNAGKAAQGRAWFDTSAFYNAAPHSPANADEAAAMSTARYQPLPTGPATLYPNRGTAAQSVGSPTLYPPNGQFQNDPNNRSVYPNGPAGDRGYIGR